MPPRERSHWRAKPITKREQRATCPATALGGLRREGPKLTRLAVTCNRCLPPLSPSGTAYAQTPKSGGILRMYHRENPPSMSIHEEATYSVNVSSMPIFNNLVIYDQHKPQNSIETIQPELATSWSWSTTTRRTSPSSCARA